MQEIAIFLYRSSKRVSPPKSPAMNTPSGFKLRWIWIMAPGRSLIQCIDKLLTTHSKLFSGKGRFSSSTIRLSTGTSMTKVKDCQRQCLYRPKSN